MLIMFVIHLENALFLLARIWQGVGLGFKKCQLLTFVSYNEEKNDFCNKAVGSNRGIGLCTDIVTVFASILTIRQQLEISVFE